MPTPQFFGFYGFFYPGPGTPKELKCVGCKVASAGALLTLSTLCLYKSKQVIMKNLYPGMGIGIAGLFLGAAGAVAGRLAYEDEKWNNQLFKKRKEELKIERKGTGAREYKSKEKANRSDLQYP